MSAAVDASFDIDALLDDAQTRIIVCCGAGGVGKTTTSAALAVRAADRGRHAVVLTIDPAKRLAQSLGVGGLTNEPQVVSVPGAKGSLAALMLDMKETFDEVVLANADPERAREILANPIYAALSTSFAGTQEYMAMEKLAQLSARAQADGAWDLIIVDTPPSRSALDFLDAPERLGSFLDGPFMRMLMAPARRSGRFGMKALGAGLGAVSSALDRILGAELLGDARTFVAALDAVFGSFRTRADATFELLTQPGTAFVVVAAPERDALREAAFFIDRLERESMPLAGLIVNRVHHPRAHWLPAERAAAARDRIDDLDAGSADTTTTLADELLALHETNDRRHVREQRLIEATRRARPHVRGREVRAMPDDVHDLAGLRAMGAALTSE